MTLTLGFWLGFHVLVLGMLALDLGLFHRKAHAVSVREALAWSLVWIGLAAGFGAAIYWWQGAGPALEFLTGYLIEKALSVDNIFVFVLIFSYFRVPDRYQHRVLFWGVLGAIAMRAALIFAGASLLARFHWIIYLFGAFLVVTGIRMAIPKAESADLTGNPAIRLLRRMMPVSDDYDGPRFLTVQGGVRMATPLLMVLVLVEFSDLVFAVDSIPAIFAVTRDPFLVYTSNLFAILGLRSLYFLLAGVVSRFRYLKYGLAAVLCFVGAKMLLAEVWKVPTPLSLLVILLLIGASVLWSLWSKEPG